MTLPGGAAAKLGYRYEKWWTRSELVRMLGGETDSLQIEPPGLDGVEFVVKSGNRQEFHQAKRSHTSGKWSPAILASKGVLRSIGQQLIGNEDRFVFVSGSDARELKDLCEAARSAESTKIFEDEFLKAQARADLYRRLLEEWNCDDRDAWGVLRRTEVKTIDDRELETKVRWGLAKLFADADRALDALSAIEDAVDPNIVHRTIARNDLLSQLAQSGCFLRKLREPQHARQVIDAATDRYLRDIRRGLIQGALIPRNEATNVVARLTEEQPSDCVLTGQAGAGKTGCVMEVVQKLRSKGVRLFVFRLDRHMSATSATDLGERLGLEESPVLVLSAAAQADHAPAVLVIDQLDAVSTMSGRGSEAFDVVEQLLAEAKAASIGTLVVCRAFDWRNDPCLRNLIHEDDREVNLERLSLGEVREVLVKAHLNASALSNRQLDLLRLPQNLSLFLNANFSTMTFSTVSDLFGRYWDEKRMLVGQRAEGEGDQWISVIDTMCEAMSTTQQLSVRKERLDQFSPGYLNQYISENVLVADGDGYAFGHESFFDYCFARRFALKGGSLVPVLTSSEQHLFRRTQVRQILAYLRRADFERYAKELRSLLSSDDIRAHIKGLIFAQLADVEDPQDAEWKVWMDCARPHLDALENGTTNHDRLSKLAWQHLFSSRSWFEEFDNRGVIAGWLKQDGRQADLAVDYLSLQQRDWSDRVAALIEPYVDLPAEWALRFQKILSRSQPEVGGRLLDVFLLLLDKGTFDATGDNQLGDYGWQVLWTLDESPEWVSKVVGRLLRRYGHEMQGEGIAESTKVWRYGLSDHSVETISAAAKGHPQAFVRHVLPAVLELAETAPKRGSVPPVRDTVWPFLFKGGQSFTDSCLEALTAALGKLAPREDLRKQIDRLLGRETHIANHLLLAIYRGGATRYADEAVLAFCDRPWRFDCGYADNTYWCAAETLKAIVPHCRTESLVRLEGVILAYVSRYEKTRGGVRRRGWAAFNLLAAIPEELLSDYGRRRFGEWQRKFHGPATASEEVVGVVVGPPIAPEDLDRMGDDDWLRAITAYPSERSTNRDRGLGGAIELAQAFERGAQQDPERFARIGLRLPPEINPVYFSALLRSLAETAADEGAKLAVCRRVFDCARVECGGEIADLLAEMETALPQDALEVLAWLAIEAEDLEEEEEWRKDISDGWSYWEGDMYANGINTTRGRSALAIGRLILKDGSYISRLRSTLDELVRVCTAAVGSCVAYALRAIAYHDIALGTDLFLRMDFSEERLLGTRHVHEFLHENLHREFARMEDLIVRMLRSPHPDVSRAGARLGCMAGLTRRDALELAHEGQQGNAQQRLGSADVAAANVGEPKCRQWCEGALSVFFDDPDTEVRRVAASCFRHIPESDLSTYEDLIETFCNSPAFEEDASSLLSVLEDARAPLPAMTCLACERILGRIQGRGIHERTVGKLAFRLYQQHPNDEWTGRALDLIDCLCLEAPGEARRGLEDFER